MVLTFPPPMTNAMPKPPAPANRADLKTWTIQQLEYAAPFWVAKLEMAKASDLALVAYCHPYTQMWLDALDIQKKHLEQLRYWKLIQGGYKCYRLLPPSLRTYTREASYNECGQVRKGCTVGSWDKAVGIWS